MFRLSPQRAAEGTYTSLVRDAQTVADWGTLSWRASVPAGARVDVFTRSGNTATPDDTWSAWSGPYAAANGEEIKSPNARYLQWKAVLGGKADEPCPDIGLGGLRAAQPAAESDEPDGASMRARFFRSPTQPAIPDIAGFDDQAPDRRILSATPNPGGSSSALGRRVYQRGLQTFVWRAEDANDDDLRYEILYRREGETGWKSLKSELEEAIFVWDTTSVPNGTYVVKVMASDEAVEHTRRRAGRRARKLGVRYRQRASGSHRQQLASCERAHHHPVRGPR